MPVIVSPDESGRGNLLIMDNIPTFSLLAKEKVAKRNPAQSLRQNRHRLDWLFFRN